MIRFLARIPLGHTFRSLRVSSVIAKKLFRYSVLIGVVSSLIILPKEYYDEYHQQIQSIEENTDQIVTLISPALSQHIWDINQKSIDIQIKQLEEASYIKHAELNVDSNTPAVVERMEQATQIIKKSYPIIRIENDRNVRLGYLTIELDFEEYRKVLVKRLLGKFFVDLFFILMLSLGVTIIFHALVTRRLLRITDQLVGVSAEDLANSTPEENFKSVEGKRQDELDDLAQSISLLWKTSHEALNNLKESENRWRFALDSAYQGLWDWDLTNQTLFFSTNWKHLLGYDEHEIGSEYQEWTSRIHPEDTQVSQKLIDSYIKGETSFFEQAQRLKTKSGDYRWFLARGKVMSRDAQGKPTRLIGTHTDITELKEAQQGLELAATVYHQALEGMLLINADNNIIMVNNAFTKITGYSEDEAIGRPPAFLRSRRTTQETLHSITERLKNVGHWQGELWGSRKNGDDYAAWMSISTIFDEDKNPSRYVLIFSDITEKKTKDDLIWHQAHHDSLTGLPNRQLFSELLKQTVMNAERKNTKFWVMYLDLDRFKEVNDTLGHLAGDALLIKVTQRLSKLLRKSDTIARLGGDEFAITLNDIDNIGHVDRVAQQIIDNLSESFDIENERVFISASIGIVQYPDDAKDVNELLRLSDQAMYKVKHEGRNHFGYYTPMLQDDLKRRVEISNGLREALANDEFEVYYQPIINMQTLEILKAEALLRWKHPEYGYISPSDFIPIAEENGLICDIGEWVFDSAIKQLAIWKYSIHPDFQISVNKSPVQFYADKHGLQSWIDRLADHGLTDKSIVVEITEGLLLNLEDSVSNLLLDYRDIGIEVAIDDFGTGYSSLAYLNKFDIDYLKIDQSFVRDIVEHHSQRAISEAIIVMAHALDIKVIAEGVETREQYEILKALGCDFAQGYFFSRPIPAPEFDFFIREAQERLKKETDSFIGIGL